MSRANDADAEVRIARLIDKRIKLRRSLRSSWGEAIGEQKKLRDYARYTFPDYGERLRFLQGYSERSCRIIDALFEVPLAAVRVDNLISKHSKRKRGDRTKLDGMRMAEEIAVNCVRARANQLKLIGIPAFERWDAARKEIAPYFGISPSTLHDWQRGVQRRERQKPTPKRSHARRKRFSKRD